MEKIDLPGRIVARMMDQDFFSQWLGVTIDEVLAGSCMISMVVRKEMLNGFGISHGGIAFSLADSALAFASNSRNKKSLVINTSVSFASPVREGDRLTAHAVETNITNRLGVYQITVVRNNSDKVLLVTGTVFRKEELWFPDEE